LFCDATGKPTPNVTWTRVWENGTDGDVEFIGNPWVIESISRTTTGTYRCTAYNGIGNPVNHSLKIIVTCKYICTDMDVLGYVVHTAVVTL